MKVFGVGNRHRVQSISYLKRMDLCSNTRINLLAFTKNYFHKIFILEMSLVTLSKVINKWPVMESYSSLFILKETRLQYCEMEAVVLVRDDTQFSEVFKTGIFCALRQVGKILNRV